MTLVLDAVRREELRKLAEGATPGPWQVKPHEIAYLLPAREMMGQSTPGRAGHHVERLIFTTGIHGQLKSPAPVVGHSIGIGEKPGTAVDLVYISEADAAHIAANSPSTTLALLAYIAELEAGLRAAVSAMEAEAVVLSAAQLAPSCAAALTRKASIAAAALLPKASVREERK